MVEEGDAATPEELEEQDAEDPVDAPQEATVASVLLGVVILVALVGGAIYGIVQLAPDKIREKHDPGFIDNIFANDVVVAGARVVVLFAAVVALAGGVYIAVSMAVRMSRGEWLREAGPFKSQVIEDKLEEATDFFDDWMEALGTNADLEERLIERDEAIETLLTEREALIEALEEGRRT